ncbi:hypothetical protein C8J55DRAFT_521385 [Lentinula edodes]|uniref:Uncharacterized protein n=1 Tax=Lentinula lateritia TaxID=40482 RepID=A0A9W9A1C1_9AGAR|nr:hypothetical protein C8J55DRAFT_521385 [Lentinula edodes]
MTQDRKLLVSRMENTLTQCLDTFTPVGKNQTLRKLKTCAWSLNQSVETREGEWIPQIANNCNN